MTRRGPDVFIIGAMKSGTTSLHAYLCQHPCMRSAQKKEVHYYDRHAHAGWTLDDYIDQFPERAADIRSLDATPNMMLLPTGARRLHADFPDIRIIALLRDPVDRAYSQYQQRVLNGKETLDFETLMEQEMAIPVENWDALHARGYEGKGLPDIGGYLVRSRYAQLLAPWLAQFGPDRVHVAFTQELETGGGALMDRVTAFLDLPTFAYDLAKRHHERRYAPMTDAIRARLMHYFEPHDAALASLLGRALPWRA